MNVNIVLLFIVIIIFNHVQNVKTVLVIEKKSVSLKRHFRLTLFPSIFFK